VAGVCVRARGEWAGAEQADAHAGGLAASSVWREQPTATACSLRPAAGGQQAATLDVLALAWALAVSDAGRTGRALSAATKLPRRASCLPSAFCRLDACYYCAAGLAAPVAFYLSGVRRTASPALPYALICRGCRQEAAAALSRRAEKGKRNGLYGLPHSLALCERGGATLVPARHAVSPTRAFRC